MPVDTSIYQMIRPTDFGVSNTSGNGLETGMQMGMKMREIHNQENQQARNNSIQDQQLAQQRAMMHFNNIGGALNQLSKLPPDEQAKQYPAMRQQLINQGAISGNDAPEQYDPGFVNVALGRYQQSKDYIDKQHMIGETNFANANASKVPSEIEKNIADAGGAAIKRNSDLYGSRSPNAELSAQYSKDVAPIKSSQVPMKQMMDNYSHPSPQGDASLVLNAFKIKFPTAPDVNSLEELSKSQATPDQWKQMAARALQGGLDQGTRDNLLRDAASTFRANYDSYQDIADRYKARAKQQNVNDPTLTYEPALDKTYKQAMDMQDKIGPYVPPSQRGGIGGAISGLASRAMGVANPQSAAAATPKVKPGTEDSGYIFMGGDPASPQSWKRAK